MPAWAAGELLAVGGDDFCGIVDIKLQGLVFRNQVFGKIAGINIFAGIAPTDDDSLVLRWIDQRDRHIGVIEGSDAHSWPQTDAADHVGIRAHDEVIDALGVADGHLLLAAVVVYGRDVLDNPVDGY